MHVAAQPHFNLSPNEARRSLLTCLNGPAPQAIGDKLAAPLAKAGGRAAWYCDLAIVLGACGLKGWQKQRVFELGCGDAEFLSVIHSEGAEGVGVEKATAPATAFEPTLTIHRGALAQFETDALADVFVSRNTLKRGFVRPVDGASPRFSLGSSVLEALTAIADKTREGGLFCIYNVSPTDAALAHEAHADGHCPFTRQELAAAGFDVLLHDADATSLTTAVARELATPALASGVRALVTVCVRRA